ncbi:MAG TPA: cyclopropane-fatty-acyl-phospholipid synthase family protein [Opitutaceae bacterium]|nr:cyclopropane-fatty-acyl-phospholipid synthase family protein [Opitutaceae bacterium]
MTLALESAAQTTVAFLDRLFARKPLEHVSIKLWDGALWPDETPRAATVDLKHPGSLRAMLEGGNAKGLGEAFVRGDYDVEGDLEKAVEMALALEDRPHGWLESLTNFYRVHRLPPGPRETAETAGKWKGSRHSPSRDRDVVSYHYDVSNDFYQLWLDMEMAYSCAYFETPDTPLDAAQRAKFRMLCRKLRLRPGQRLLDIGCGWGGFARFAARTCGVEVLGITLSENQAALAAQRTRDAGMSECVKIERRDYRHLESAGEFDAVASVGMAEHVGRENLKDYFATVRSLLKPGGVFLNHAIGEGRSEKRFQGPSFIDAYVFPDSDIPPLPIVLVAAEDAGFEIRDVENLREHYMLTLRHWVRRLEENREKARSMVSDATYRVWRLYMAASAHGFDHGNLAIYQTLLAKPHADGLANLPLTRRDWYEE